MSDFAEPELHVIRFPPEVGAERRAQAARHRQEARTRYLAQLTSVSADAAAVLDALTTWNDVTSGEPCICSCHPRLPETDFHDYGFGCSCRSTPEVRRRKWDAWRAELDEFWATPEGMGLRVRKITTCAFDDENPLVGGFRNAQVVIFWTLSEDGLRLPAVGSLDRGDGLPGGDELNADPGQGRGPRRQLVGPERRRFVDRQEQRRVHWLASLHKPLESRRCRSASRRAQVAAGAGR